MDRQNNFKSRVNNLVFSLHKEILKTSSIGKKLISAGRTNSHLKETYEELGKLVELKITRGELDVDDVKMGNLLHTIKVCKQELKEIEEQVNKIRFPSGPEVITDQTELELSKKNEEEN